MSAPIVRLMPGRNRSRPPYRTPSENRVSRSWSWSDLLKVGIQLIADDLSALHHELHSLHLGDIFQRITADRDDVGVLALLEAADTIRPPVVEDARRGEKRGLQRLRRRHAPLHEERELVRLLAMRVSLGNGAAAEWRRHPGGEEFLKCHLAH